MVMRLNKVKNKLKSSLKALSLVLLIGVPALEAAQYERKAAAAFGTAIYWGLTVAQPVGMVQVLKQKSNIEKEYKEDHAERNAELLPNVMPFLKNELNAIGLPDARIIPHLTQSFALMKDVCIGLPLLEKSEKSLARIHQAEMDGCAPLAEDIKTIHELQGVLNHEANHLLHGDTKWRFFAAALGSACVPIGLRAAYRAARPVADTVKKMPNVRKVLSGLVNMTASGNLYNVASREVEQQADNAIQGAQRLQGMVYFLEKNDAALREQCKDNPFSLWLVRHAASHPSPASRIAKLQSRLQES